MDITINEASSNRIHLRLPTALVTNGISAAVISGQLQEKVLDISGKQLRRLFRAVKKYRAQHPQWTLVEVESHDGHTVQIVV